MSAIRVVLSILLGVFACGALAGQIVGGTYISEKDGSRIEIPAEGWDIKDREKPGSHELADLDLSRTINGSRPSLVVNRLGDINPEVFIERVRALMELKGAQPEPMVNRVIAGKPVSVMRMTLEILGKKVYLVLYGLKGEKTAYILHFTVESRAFEESSRFIEELVEKVKY